MKTNTVKTRNGLVSGPAAVGRAAALVVGLSLGAAAAVIDDMSGPLKGASDAVAPQIAEIVNGRLVFGGELVPGEGPVVGWYNSLPAGELGERTLELRLDVVSISANGFFCFLGVRMGDEGVTSWPWTTTRLAWSSTVTYPHCCLAATAPPRQAGPTTSPWCLRSRAGPTGCSSARASWTRRMGTLCCGKVACWTAPAWTPIYRDRRLTV